MTKQTVEDLANTIGLLMDRLLVYMRDAGLPHTKNDDTLTDSDTTTLLNYLKKENSKKVAHVDNKTRYENPINIRNCNFAFRCTQTWNSLKKTEHKRIRYCSDCNRGVHFCKTDQELTKAIHKNWCVAIDTVGDIENLKITTKRLLGYVRK